MAERTVMSSFHTRAEAKKAEDKIRTLGVEATEVSELHAHPGTESAGRDHALNGDMSSLASITLDTVPNSRDSGILLAAAPSASGMSDVENITGRNFLLTAVCPEDLVNDVVSIIKDCNGYT